MPVTIEGVRVTIASGFAEVRSFQPDAGVTRLKIGRVSHAADKRGGRPDHAEPSICWQ
jgi:HrpA-like RNA helicase